MALGWLPRDNSIKDHSLFGTEHWGEESPCTRYEKKPIVGKDG